MKNYKDLSNNFNCNSKNDNYKPKACNDDCTDSIFFSGLCDGEGFDISTRFWTELSINGSICVPEQKPLIEQIDSINSKTEILSVKVITTPGELITTATLQNYEGRVITGRKIIVEGLICLTVTYVSTNRDQSVHSFHGKIPFSAFIVILKTIQGEDSLNMNFLVSSCIEEICVKSIYNRVVNLTANFILSASRVASPCNENYFKGSGIECNDAPECLTCEDDHKIITKGVATPEKLKNLISSPQDPNLRYWNEISVPEVLTIPNFKPNIEQILSINSKVEIMCQKVIETPVAVTNMGQNPPDDTGKNLANLMLTGRKLIIEALLRQRITYVSATDCQSIHSAHFDIPISTYIMVPNATLLTDKFKIICCIEDIYACILNPRQIFKNTTLFFKALQIKCPIRLGSM